MAGNRKAADLRSMGLKKGCQPRLVQWLRFATVMVMAPVQQQARVTLQRVGQTVGLQITFLETDINQPNATSLPLYQRIGCQRGRQ